MESLKPTRLGLGCWALGGDQWGKQDDAVSIRTITRALGEGINHFDTAQMYGRGHGEELLGRVLRSRRNSVFIATKILYSPKGKVEAAVAASLRRLQSDYLDLIYIHWPKRNGDLAGMMEELERMRGKGLVRLIGVSNFTPAQMQEVMKAGTLDVHQLCCNVLWRREEKETIPFCIRNSIAVVTYSSLAEGILTGKFTTEPVFPQGDHRRNTLLFDKQVWPHVAGAVGRLASAAAREGRPLAHCAIRWLLSRPGVVSVLAGARSPEQVSENCGALAGEISPVCLDRMTEISDSLASRLPDEGNIFRWYP